MKVLGDWVGSYTTPHRIPMCYLVGNSFYTNNNNNNNK